MKTITKIGTVLIVLFVVSVGEIKADTSIYFNTSSMSFTVDAGTFSTQSVILLGSDVSYSAQVLSYSAEITGTDASQFYYDSPTGGYDILYNLVYGGQPFNITYNPSWEGPHEAILRVTLNLTGMIYPAVAEITIRGDVNSPTGIQAVDSETKEVASVTYYTVSGSVVQPDKPGIYIKKVQYNDGSVKTSKFMKYVPGS